MRAPNALYLIKHMLRVGGDALWNVIFCRDKRITREDRVWHELFNLCDLFYFASCPTS